MIRFACCSFLIFVFTSQSAAQRLQFQISGRGLPNADLILRRIDPYVRVYFTQIPLLRESYLGRTESKRNSNNPEWSTVFDFNYNPVLKQTLVLKLYDRDKGRDNLIAQGTLNMQEYILKGEEAIVPLGSGALLVHRASPPVEQGGVVGPPPTRNATGLRRFLRFPAHFPFFG